MSLEFKGLSTKFPFINLIKSLMNKCWWSTKCLFTFALYIRLPLSFASLAMITCMLECELGNMAEPIISNVTAIMFIYPFLCGRNKWCELISWLYRALKRLRQGLIINFWGNDIFAYEFWEGREKPCVLHNIIMSLYEASHWQMLLLVVLIMIKKKSKIH